VDWQANAAQLRIDAAGETVVERGVTNPRAAQPASTIPYNAIQMYAKT
jgi:hypothetical protein